MHITCYWAHMCYDNLIVLPNVCDDLKVKVATMLIYVMLTLILFETVTRAEQFIGEDKTYIKKIEN